MKRGLLLLSLFSIFFIFTISFVSSQVYINEVMPNPTDNCNDCTEWLELYSSEPNFIGWINTGESKNLSLNTTIQDHLVITKNKTAFLSYWNVSPEKIIELAIGLTNSGDKITLYDKYNTTIDFFNWSKDIGNKSWAKINETFIECSFPTPGMLNLCEQEQNKENETNQTNETYKPLIFLNFPSQVYNNKTNFTIQALFKNFSQGNYDLKLDIKNGTKYLNRLWLNEGEWSDKNSWIDNFTYIDSMNFTQDILNIIDIDNSFVGNASLQLKIRNETSIFYSDIYNLSVINGTSQENNQTNETEENNEQEESSIKISDSPSKAKFGQDIDIDLEIYKGSTNKYALYVYVEDEDKNKVSEKKTLHLRTKYKDYEETVSLDLDCLNESGNYKIIAEGLDDRDTETIYLESCFEKTTQSSSISQNIKNNLVQNNLSQQNQNPQTQNTYPINQNNNFMTGSAISSDSNNPNFLEILPIILGVFIIVLAVIIKKGKRS